MAEPATPTGNNALLREAAPVRKIGRLERFLGPENYRIITGLLKTPASILGFILIALFIFIALAAPYYHSAGQAGCRSLHDPARWLQLRTPPDDVGLDAQCTAFTFLVETHHADGSLGASSWELPRASMTFSTASSGAHAPPLRPA